MTKYLYDNRDWYNNQEAVAKLKEAFEKAGLPLEYRAKKIFEDNGFEAAEYHYKYPEDHVFDDEVDYKDGTWRQIDIRASPKGNSFDTELRFGKFRLVLTLEIIGECKFSSNKSFFLFKSDDQHILNFPPTIWGDNLLPIKLGLLDSDNKALSSVCLENPTKYFRFDVYENVVEVDFKRLEFKDDNNFNDKTTYRDCEQLYNAVNYHFSVAKPELREDTYIQIYESALFKKWIFYLINNNIAKEDAMPFGNRILDSVALNFLKENFNLADIQNIFHCIFCNFPIFIINESAGLYEVLFDEKKNIYDFKKINYGLYTYNAQECHNSNRCIYPDSLGIIICDVSCLKELIESIVKGINELGQHLKRNLEKWPYLLGYELLFNPELIDPNDYFSDLDDV